LDSVAQFGLRSPQSAVHQAQRRIHGRSSAEAEVFTFDDANPGDAVIHLNEKSSSQRHTILFSLITISCLNSSLIWDNDENVLILKFI